MPHHLVSIVPQPTKITVIGGEYSLSPGTQIVAEPALRCEAEFLARRLRAATGYPFEIHPAPPREGTWSLWLELDPSLERLGEEGYILEVTPCEVRIKAVAPVGVSRGIQSLLQLLPPAIFDKAPRIEVAWKLPRVLIEDSPRFSWRGAMLDCGRYFLPAPFIKKFIDLLALHKLNVFHWHLTEDQGWRIEIKKYPRLTEIGAFRRETIRGYYDARAGGDGIPHGGFYSQDEIKEIVAYATERHITVVPEIEMPGHCQAALAAYPEFGSTGESCEVSTIWGVDEKMIFNPHEKTILFLQDVLAEVLELFPSRFIHIGGDEAPKGQWKANPAIQKRMAEVGACDVMELQSYFIRRMDAFLTERGRRLVGWDEILEGGLAPGATVMSWRGIKGGIAAARSGHDTVMAPDTHTYLNYYQSDDTGGEPIAISSGYLTLQKTYEYEPVPRELSPNEATHILGLQGQLWGEYMSNAGTAEYLAFPRLAAIAEVGWSTVENRRYDEFEARMKRHLKRLNVLQVHYRPLD